MAPCRFVTPTRPDGRAGSTWRPPNPAAARSFYEELFGWTAGVDPRPEAGGYAQFKRDGHAVADVGPIFAEGMPPSWRSLRHRARRVELEPAADRDKEAAVAFYGAVFDWRLREHPDWGEHLALGEDGGEIAGVTQMGDEFPPDVPPHWVVTFMVDDADALAWRAQELGGTAIGPVEDMVMGGRVGSLADPQGASFGILSFATPFS
jgi:uncharacterized protein